MYIPKKGLLGKIGGYPRGGGGFLKAGNTGKGGNGLYFHLFPDFLCE